MTYLRTLTVEDSRSGVKFLVVDLLPGQYTNRHRMTNDHRRVEFFDARYPHTTWGQFIADYDVNTLIGQCQRGLMLDSGVPAWRISAQAWAIIEAWLTTTD